MNSCTKKGRLPVFDKARYCRGYVVERSFGCLKNFCRFSTRYEKLVVHFVAFIQLDFCMRYLRELLVDRTSAFWEHCLETRWDA
ncbi:transposase [Aeromonas veronii]|nr:transposase [Aeromonas veronii]MBE8739173.1 transposase [Aeromonas veronii]MBE8744536.1 transposase [Aeromonas veronii]MBE8763517.1 transposase [Aeromonas veronii]MBE8839895.1 transposase [Aeromonas veronii]